MARTARVCGKDGCPEVVIGANYCPTHTVKAWATTGPRTRNGSTRAGRKIRAHVLRYNPVCQCPGCTRCTPNGCDQPSTDDDHRINLAAGGSDRLSNHQGLCAACHRVKTQAESRQGRDPR